MCSHAPFAGIVSPVCDVEGGDWDGVRLRRRRRWDLMGFGGLARSLIGIASTWMDDQHLTFPPEAPPLSPDLCTLNSAPD